MIQSEITIIGGGMVGISLALMLSDKLSDETKIQLIEQHPFPSLSKQSSTLLQPSFDARSTALSVGSVELLSDIDCWQGLSEHTEAIRDIHISDSGHFGGSLLEAKDYGEDALGYVVENRHLGQVLLQRLQETSVELIAPAIVESCCMKKNGAELSVKVKDQTIESVYTKLVIIADGAQSPLAKSLGIESTRQPYQQTAIMVNVGLEKPHQGIAYERFTDQGPLALLPLNDCDGQHRAAVVWTRKPEQADHLMALSNEDFLSELQQCFGYRADFFSQVGERHTYPLALVQSGEQVRSNVVVMGNAAHFLHPVAGQGFNLSLRDCATLAEILAEAIDEKLSIGNFSVLQSYESLRSQDQQRVIGLTDAMVKLFSSQNLSQSVLRQNGLFMLNLIPEARHTLARQMMGVLS